MPLLVAPGPPAWLLLPTWLIVAMASGAPGAKVRSSALCSVDDVLPVPCCVTVTLDWADATWHAHANVAPMAMVESANFIELLLEVDKGLVNAHPAPLMLDKGGGLAVAVLGNARCALLAVLL